jgi:hypothetical protein
MKWFMNHWGTEFLLKECFGNLYTYHCKLASRPTRSKGSCSTKRDQCQGSSKTKMRDDTSKKCGKKSKSKTCSTDNDHNSVEYQCQRDAHRAALCRSVQRSATKRKAESQDDKGEGEKDVKQKTLVQARVEHEGHVDRNRP